MRYELAIFDFDGTLADSFGWFMANLNTVAQRFGLKTISPEEAEMLRGRHNREIIAHMGVPLWKIPMIARHMRQLATRDIQTIRPFPGVEQMLRGLVEAGLKVAVVTSNSRENVDAVLGPGLTRHIAHFECGASLFGKAAKFSKTLKARGVAPGRAIALGDEVRDIEAARSAGIACAAVAWGYATREVLQAHGPDMLLEAIDEVAPALTAKA